MLKTFDAKVETVDIHIVYRKAEQLFFLPIRVDHTIHHLLDIHNAIGRLHKV